MEISASHESIESSHDDGALGLWLFIASEILLFGGFLAGYVMIRWGSTACALGTPAWPAIGSSEGLFLATLNTFVLITSSFTMARATLFAKDNDHLRTRWNIAATLGLGVVFLLIKGFEYSVKIHHGYFPRTEFMKANPGLVIFVSFYFALTGLHVLHVIAGLIWNGALYHSVGQGSWNARFAKKLEYAGIYWHFVDVIWIFLFPLFYLI